MAGQDKAQKTEEPTDRGKKKALIKKVHHGKRGRYASFRLTAHQDLVVRLVISQWPKNGSIQPPNDASYTLTAVSKCSRRETH